MTLDPIPLSVTALVALLLGMALAGWRGARRVDDWRHACAEREAQVEALREQLGQWQVALQERDARLSQAESTAARLEAEREAARQQQIEYRHWWEVERERRESLGAELAELKTTHGELTATLAQKESHFHEQFATLRESRDALKQEFENLANEILERKGRAFSALSQERIGGLLQPIHSEMKGFRETVESIQRQESEQRVQLRTELQNLQSLNRAITDQAERLTQALQGQKKTQGNWGELMLENVLDGAGLRRGTDYEREVSFTTEEGRRRPDALVYLPQQRHLVIDAKTSLAAYTRYVNADDESERRRALAEHCQAVRDRIDELADRHYYDLPGLNSPEVVVMFVPVESAFVEAIKHDATLYQHAIEHHVLVATPTTLLTSLNIVRQLWRFENQSRHSAELADRAEKFHAKLAAFLASMEDVGKRLDGARTSYDRAMNQLLAGKGNLIKQADEFRELGVAVKKELPRELVERARLELDHGSGEPSSAGLSDRDTSRSNA
ncbi:MAG: DNA recombination protein RmuC [Halomonadaceae bacterium T82-2]|nr:MAG: DNA recombination protein RmuC [Halomonadaceae bacterium T82-2]